MIFRSLSINKYFFFLALITLPLGLKAQFAEQQIVHEGLDGIVDVSYADIDGDGDYDVLTSSWDIFWNENLDGAGHFGPAQMIESEELFYAIQAVPADLDGDGDLDVLASFLAEEVIGVQWLENLDGQGNFGELMPIDEDVLTAYTVLAADLDNDDDMDVLLVDRNADKIAWYENLNGLGNFSQQQIISSELDWPIRAVIADLDGDGLDDIFTHSYDEHTVGWIRNEGDGQFSSYQIIDSELVRPSMLHAFDIDMDGDMDLLSGSLEDHLFTLYINQNSQGDFGERILISDQIEYPYNAETADFDKDGDQDLICSYWYNDGTGASGILLMENLDGAGSFGQPQLISDQVTYVTRLRAVDLDMDQDIDILSSSQHDEKIAWYENDHILAIVDGQDRMSTVFPNPFEGFVKINSHDDIVLIEIHDGFGRLIHRSGPVSEIDTHQFTSGLYIITLHYENGNSKSFKLIKS